MSFGSCGGDDYKFIRPKRGKKMTEPATPRSPAAFINAIAGEEGTKKEAVEWLQKTWDEKCQLEHELASAKEELKEQKRLTEQLSDVMEEINKNGQLTKQLADVDKILKDCLVDFKARIQEKKC